ncbi:hypothetical protein L1277_001772 [Okibacterium sp. HSC-33S16]|uniref:polysaccharide pyruvyl transferase family protein n=1 Tax=Okibacterium sp. HSC-33S16 TaxID=2910965 RepID=UPI00209DEBA4|nr:polysaccharide pyruvyl transferase family protein [Okibacterium sp. HSC-33S16]MCP2031674.1 hypothetical protein [Okibacterium sp. HSC-33S16]
MAEHANLLYDSISPNTGDIAIGIAGQQLFEGLGVRSSVVDPFSDRDVGPLVIGGGELIRETGDPFYDRFRRKGNHILNAAGVWTSATDLGYLNDYAFVSARSSRELQVLKEFVPGAELMPCATTMLESPHFEIPGVEKDEPVVGIHLVPHSLRLIDRLAPLINAIPHKKVFIPFTHYNGDKSFMKSLPFDWSNSVVLDELEPLELHSVIGQMKYVVVSSLHASIFAYSQNVPFASVYQKKAHYYFDDRQLADHVVANEGQLTTLLRRLENEKFDFRPQVAEDRRAIEKAFRTYRDLLGGAGAQETAPPESEVPSLPRDRILLQQAQQVLGDRDLVLAYSEHRLDDARRTIEILEEDNRKKQAEIDLFENSRTRRLQRRYAGLRLSISRLFRRSQ